MSETTTSMSLDQGQHLVRLLRTFFFNREDKVAAQMPWGKPHPVIGLDNLPGLLLAHVMGEASPHKGAARYENRQGALKVQQGLFRIGSYTPDDEGNTCWLCLDFDGPGHSDPLEDPEAAVRLTYAAFSLQGLPAYMERSGGGKGWHLWVFFSQPTSAAIARKLAHRLVPDNLPLGNGRGVAMPRSNRGVEIFPKQDKPTTPKRLGNLVYLPWFHGAPVGANQFYREEDGELVSFVPETFETITPADAERILVELSQSNTSVQSNAAAVDARTRVDEAALEEFLRRATKDDDARQAPSQDLREWKERALPRLDLDLVYGRWFTGERSGDGWQQCRDPDSPSGVDSKSGNVADGSGQALRGTYHSWRTDETLSVFDFMVRYGLATGFLDAARQVAQWSGVPLPERSGKPEGSSTPQQGYPTIVVNNRQTRDIRYDAEQVLVAANAVTPFLFNRAGRVVRVVMVQGTPHIRDVDSVVMYDQLARVADWVRRTDEGDFDVPPPMDVSKLLVASPSPELPWLDGVVTAPVFDPRGALVDQPGYNREAGIWYHQEGEFSVAPVPITPSPADILEARSLLMDELLVDFPFVSEADRAHAVAALLLPFVRRLISGPTPLHLFEAPTPGAGKTLLADAMVMVATGHPAEPMTLGHDDEETRKKITSMLSLGSEVVLIDNVRTGIDSVSLAAALTADVWQDRLLGQNTMVRFRNRTAWYVTANNPSLSLEIARRCVRIRIEPAGDRPWQREGFKHAPLKLWVKENRPRLVWAVLVLVRAWLAGGRPSGTQTLGSFEDWASVIGGILDVAGIPGFLANANELYEAADVEGQEWREFVAAWWEVWGKSPVSAGQLLELAKDKEMLLTILGPKNERSQAIRLGKSLKMNRDRVFDGLRVVASWAKHRKQNAWKLIEAEHSDNGVDGNILDLFGARDVKATRDVENPTSRATSRVDSSINSDSSSDCGMLRDVNPNLAGACERERTDAHDTHAHAPTRVWDPETHPATSRKMPETLAGQGIPPRDVSNQHPAQHPANPKQHPASVMEDWDVDLANLPDDEVDS